MSHYYVIALVPRGTEDVEGKVKEMLAPYSENLEVPEHSVRCGCVGWLAELDVWERIDSRFGTPEELGRKFAETATLDESDSEKWRVFMAPVFAAEEEMMDCHELKDEPDETCPDCGGTGEFLTTYNPESKWDRWDMVGGRSGVLGPVHDAARGSAGPDVPIACGGNGVEPSEDANGSGAEAMCRLCPGTAGSGAELAEACACKGVPAMEFLSLLDRDIERHCPFAVLTSDGEWHERGRMMMLGCVSGEMPRSEWHEEVRTVVAAHADCLAVECDLHV